MTSPFAEPGPSRNHRANWLGRYLGVQAILDAELNKALEQAAEDCERILANVKGDSVTAQVQRIQYNLALRSIRRHLHELFLSTGNIIRHNRKDAAEAAVDAQIKDESIILSRIFPDKSKRESYEASLRQTARRSVESTIARIYISEIPLSQRVYKTEALANGQVKRIVNSSLARGTSAREIAKQVASSIRPGSPGGIEYAAKRLGRTELNNAFHAQAIVENQGVPWVDRMEWYLSKVHEKDDCLCEQYAKQRRFSKYAVPKKPHPNCRCYVVPVMVDWTEFENNLLIGAYDIFVNTRLLASVR